MWYIYRYERADEIIWVKTNQLQRIIRTGRTGHWLNHGKEHCLVIILWTETSWYNLHSNINRCLTISMIFTYTHMCFTIFIHSWYPHTPICASPSAFIYDIRIHPYRIHHLHSFMLSTYTYMCFIICIHLWYPHTPIWDSPSAFIHDILIHPYMIHHLHSFKQ